MLLLSRSEDPEFVAELRIFNPDGSEAELSGNGAREAILYLRRHGWTDEDDLLDPHRGRADHADDHLASGPARSRWAAPRPTSKDFPVRRRGRHAGRSSAGGREWDFQHVSIGNPQCAIVVGEELEELDLGAIGPGDRRPRAVPEPHQRLLPARSTAAGCGRGSSSAGWGRRSPRAPAPAAPRSTAFLRGAPSPITVELDGGELEVEVSDDLDVRLTGWAEPVCAGELSPELLAALAEL